MQLTDAAEIFHPGWKKESRAGIAAPPVVGDGLFWKSHLFGICNDGCMQPLAGQRTKRRDAGAETGSLLQCHVCGKLQEVCCSGDKDRKYEIYPFISHLREPFIFRLDGC